ncbi:MAG: hypothetical protein AAF527_12460, partial [Pseudomonadota bacterium]
RPRGRFAIRSARLDRYSLGAWMRGDGDDRPLSEAAAAWRDAVRCDDQACALSPPAPAQQHRGLQISYVMDPAALQEECGQADLIITPAPAPRWLKARCAADILDKWSFWREGAHAVWRAGDGGFKIVSAESRRGARPWSKAETRAAAKRAIKPAAEPAETEDDADEPRVARRAEQRRN